MTIFHFVRHAEHVLQDRVMVGRTPGVALSSAGRGQADRVGALLKADPIDLVVTSPRRRARETAAAIVAASGAPCEVAAALDEIDLGEWTGKTFDALKEDARWQRWNAERATSRCPGGESIADVWSRLHDLLIVLAARFPSGAVVLVTHAEVVRVAALVAGRLSFGEFHRIEIAPASITTLAWQANALQPTPANGAAA